MKGPNTEKYGIMRYYTDTHAHLDMPEFDSDLESVLDNARSEGVASILCTATSLESARRCIDISKRYPSMIRACAGIHPNCSAGHSAGDFERLAELASLPEVAAIGETGLDYHHDFSDRRVQERFFRMHMELAADLGKPLVIHGRKADSQILRMLDDCPADLFGIRHCFDGTAATASEYAARGFHLAFGGLVTRKGYGKLKDALRVVPDDRLLLETDSPYLTPAGAGGGRNEPAHVKYVADAVAELRGVSGEQIAALTSSNAAGLLLC